jgi:hypothetical protein
VKIYLERKDTEFFCLLSSSDFDKLIPIKGSSYLPAKKDAFLKTMLFHLDMTSSLHRHQLFPVDKIHPSLKFACVGYTCELEKEIESFMEVSDIVPIIVDYV